MINSSTISTFLAQTKPPTMKNLLFTATLIVAFATTLETKAQELNFPERYETWKTADKGQFKFDQAALDKAVEYAKSNEYSGSRDIRQAILEGFKREPFHEILGPTKNVEVLLE